MEWLADNWQIVAAIVFAARSEIIGINPKWKENSVIGVFLWIGKRLFQKK
jgi:hypothetical protein